MADLPLELGLISHSCTLRFISDADQDSGYQFIKSIIAEAISGRNFISQTSGGVDILGYPEPPVGADKNIRHMGPPMFHIFLFDFIKNHRVIYGDQINARIPDPAIPFDLLQESLQISENRINNLEDNEVGRRRGTYLCWRLIQKSQCHFGEPTIEKTRMLYLYQRNVPTFPSKATGEIIIRQYLGTFLPYAQTMFLPIKILLEFHKELTEVVRSAIQ